MPTPSGLSSFTASYILNGIFSLCKHKPNDNPPIPAPIIATVNRTSNKFTSLRNKNNINPILCIGESFEEYKAGNTRDKLKSQIIESIPKSYVLNELIIAYEPIWAIGSGRTPEAEEVNSIHEFIKDVVQSATANNIVPKVLYGGSVNDINANDFFDEDSIDGALVGGASLDANIFANIVNIYKRLKKI